MYRISLSTLTLIALDYNYTKRTILRRKGLTLKFPLGNLLFLKPESNPPSQIKKKKNCQQIGDKEKRKKRKRRDTNLNILECTD